ncbi:hypothetical protein N658DRAFT_422656 [Parathielavia hyrcaniae]|uniref:RRM domain-containing protein n=1 Tax=Parathielavia hyrcaniae TaxID=113614 RepID=A0AAN6Q3B6_9PEZI|nr:hypothetical protein N658DRAFT_422656 [Parathielavia hyrcaniae]
MSAMIRANKSKSGGNAGRGRSYSLSNGSESGSSDSEQAGARLSAASLDDSPPRVRFSSVTEEFSRMSVTSSVASGSSDRADTSSPFQIGSQPNGDIFAPTPARSAIRLGGNLGASIMDPFLETIAKAKIPGVATDEHRLTRSATNPSAMSLAAPAERGLRTPSARHEIGGIDAQGIYPPSACVFIANLPESKDDRALEAAVTREFSRYGTVFVKIRREAKGNMIGMPYAFAQYTNDDDAKAAMDEGKGTMILGRPCRTEMVKANRNFVIYSRCGEDITTDMAREILEPYGELSKCEMLSAQMQEAMDLPPAVLVEFARFDPKRDLNSAVRQYDGYRIDAFDAKKRSTVSKTDADEDFLRRYDVDRRSVYVGGLPLETTRQDLLELFSAVGEVVSCNVLAKANYHGQISRTFAFVEFDRADAPDEAVKEFNNTYYCGELLKVERKVFRQVGTPRRVKSQAFSKSSAATPKTPRAAAAAAMSPMLSGGPSGSRQMPVPSPGPQHGYNFANAGHPLAPAPLAGFPAPSPAAATAAAAPANGQPLLGASGLPVTPSSVFGPNAFSYTGGYWPGMSFTQDAATGQTYWAYAPVGSSNAPGTPTRGAPTPGREQQQQHHFFHGA